MFRQIVKDCYHLARHRIKLALLRKEPVYVPVFYSELLKGKDALITGGSSGIGLEIAKAFLNNGAAHVIITGRSEDKLLECCKGIRKSSEGKGEISYLVMDNLSSDTQNMAENLKQALGDRKLDILVNNAGIIAGGRFGNVTAEEFDKVIGTNLRGAYLLSQIVSQMMIQHNIKGNILNIASSSSLRPAISPYTISKWGIRGLTLGMAKTLIPYGIVVNGLAPGPTATPLLLGKDTGHLENGNTPNQRYASPAEIANMAVILTSPLGRTIIGDIVYMTCGSGVITFDDIKY